MSRAGPDFVPRPGSWPVGAGQAEILADADRPGAYLLAVDGVAQSYVDLLDPGHLEFAYVRRLADVIAASGPPAPAPRRVVHVGGGAGTLARWVAATRPGSEQRVVEADAALAIGVAERLGEPDGGWVVDDGRAVVEGLPAASVDVVVTDAFVGSAVPPRLATQEYLTAVARVLGEGGISATNVADAAPFAYLRRVLATARSAFTAVLVLVEPAVLRGRRFGNAVVVAGTGLPVAALARAAAGDAAAPARLVAGADLDALVGTARPLLDAESVASPVPPAGEFSIR